MKTSKSLTIIAAVCGLLYCGKASAQVLFYDNFDSNSSALYSIVGSSSDYRVTFNYNYGAAYGGNLGIPTAPNSVGGTTTALKFEANLTGAAAVSLALSPIATFTGDYRVTFDLWQNAAGPFPGGGTGSSEFFSAGVGYNGSTFQNGTSGSGAWFTGATDGGFSGTSTSPDFSARIGATFQAANSGVYAAGTATGAVGSSVDNANAYYTNAFPGVTPPTSQTNILATQTGKTADGSLAFKWREVELDRIGNVVTFSIDGFLIATVTNAAATASDRIDIGYWDATSSLGNTNVSFGLIDNLKIQTIAAVPEPSTIALGLLGTAGLFLLLRKK